ncbi:hypothetical protein H4S07_003642 [Coemansia furcata]|uniref:Uncharacterized protein n=1 Tax=Coemansia furcata TaxID=417177 RepID=A0ACC1LEM6_9FUNG|nr:hypothetical protein H4S07_003642 [Coemansia furcata]
MVCPICHETYFGAPPKDLPTRGSTSSTTSIAHRPVALGCGHAFHKNCIEDWFESSRMQRCPQCKVHHVGPPTVLFIDIDEEDYEAGPSTRGQSNTNSIVQSRRSNADIRQLVRDINRMHVNDEARDYRVMCELASRNQALEDANMDLEEGLEEALRSLYTEMETRESEVDDLIHELEGQRRLQRRTDTLLQESNDGLLYERENTARVEKKLEAVKALATRLRDDNSNLRHTLEVKNREIREYQSQFGYNF